MPEVGCGFNDVPGGAAGKDLLESYGPTVVVDVGFDPNYKSGSKTKPVAGMTGIAALVDTGATECCIDSLLATQLNLPIVDKRALSGAHGSQEVNIHLAQVHVSGLALTMWGQFAAVHLAQGGQPHKVLMGRSFLRGVVMTYDGLTGKVTINKP